MSEKRLTKTDKFNEIKFILAGLGKEDLVEFVENEIALLAKRNSKNTLTANQKANLELVEVIYEVLAACDKAVTISELMESDERLAELSNQKMSALLKKLVDSERVVKVIEKGKAYFSIAD